MPIVIDPNPKPIRWLPSAAPPKKLDKRPEHPKQ
jgi:hypothetical protein